MPAPKSSKTIRSTDRGGAVTLTAGVLSLALGFGLLIGITLQTTAHTVVLFKNMALGLSGALYSAVPFIFLWMGWLLCVGSRHYVSFRTFIISFTFYMAFLGLLTMLTSVTGYGTLMEYMRDANKSISNISQPDNYGEYLLRAYQRYDNRLDPLPGGGAMGMLVAFPVWKILGQIGGVIFLIISLIALLFALLRISPVNLYQRFDAFLQGNKKQQVYPAEQLSDQREQQKPPQTAPEEGYRQKVEPYYVNPQPDSFRAGSTESYSSQASSRTAPVWQAPAYTERPEDEGFTAVEQDFYEGSEDNFVPVPGTRRSPHREPRASSNAVEAKHASSLNFSQPSATNATQPTSEEAAEKHEEIAATRETLQSSPMPATDFLQEEPYHSPVHGHQDEDKVRPIQPGLAHQTEEKGPVVESESFAGQKVNRGFSAGRVQEVGIASAVPLTGERVPVRSATSVTKGTKHNEEAFIKPVSKQTSMQIDSYQRPSFRLISPPPPEANLDTTEEDSRRAEKLISTLASFNIPATVVQVLHGPAVTSFGIRLAEGVNINKLRNVMDNISVELLAKSPARAEIPIPGTPLIGIEVSNETATKVFLREILESSKMIETKSPTAVALGKDIYGAPIICDLMDMPHLLIAGATGSGKSVCINSIITSLLYRASPRDVRLILIDPKFVELQPYNDGPHLLLPVVVDPKKAVMALEWVCQEMDERYKLLEKHRVRNIDGYNAKLEPDEEPMPRIVVIVDEMADLMLTAGKVLDEHIKRITAKARAAGICLILATQRPSVDVITGIIKANIPSRIAFQVSSQVDSRTILDSQGAEKLLGYGDMLYFPRTLKAPKRVQGCFISDADVAAVADYVKSRNVAEYNSDIMEHIEKEEKKEAGSGAHSSDGDEGEDSFDELLPKAIEMAVESGQMSISMLQRVLRVGYGRAGRLIDEMARRNIISGNEGTKPRKTLITREEYRQLYEDDAPF